MLTTLALLSGLLASAPESDRVVVFPFDAREFNPFQAREADQAFKKSLKRSTKLTIIESDVMSRELGVDLASEARNCNNDVLCLVQIGEILGAETLALGKLKEGEDNADVIQVLVIDVPAAKMRESLVWTVPKDSGLFESAVGSAARHLFSVPDARLVFELEPKDAQIWVFDEVIGDPPYGEDLSFWSGTYQARVVRRGYLPQDIMLRVRAGVATQVTVKLERDPLFTGNLDEGRVVRPSRFGTKKKKPNEDLIIEKPPPSGPSPFANVYAWSLVGLGGVAATIGGVMMSSAQGDYNSLSAEQRYAPDTAASRDAADARESSRSTYSTGSIFFVGGLVGAGAGFTWMLVDAIVSSPSKSERRTALVSPIAGPDGGGVSCTFAF